MFNCDMCHKAIGPRVKPIPVTVHTRAKSYVNYKIDVDDFGVERTTEINSHGHEIVCEHHYCPECVPEQIVAAPVAIMRVGGRSFEEKLPDPLKATFAGIVFERALERSNHDSLRAKADFAVAFPTLKEFSDRNTGFRI